MHIALGGGFLWHGEIFHQYMKFVLLPKCDLCGINCPSVSNNLITKITCQKLHRSVCTHF